jgi:hypothetical protein
VQSWNLFSPQSVQSWCGEKLGDDRLDLARETYDPLYFWQRSKSMKRQSVLVVFGTAAVTTVFTVMLFAPSGVGAIDTIHRIKAVITQPQFESQGCVFVLKTDKAEYEAGDRPTVDIKASNPTDKAVEAKVWINILGSAPASLASRMLPIPRVLWSHPYVVSLKPSEVKTLNITSDAKLPAGQNISFTMTDKQRAVLAINLGVKAPKGTGQASHTAQAARF